MGNVKLPSRICGEWIWKKAFLHQQDSFLLMRREFVCSSVGLETNLWISANSAYQLFINGNYIGFGPRAHQNAGTSYIDQHDITYYLESGINVIGVIVYNNTDQKGRNQRTPGLWCQMENPRQVMLCSDSSWLIHTGECCTGPRARISSEQGMTQILQAPKAPLNWNTSTFLPDASWTKPDYSTPVGAFGARLELHPLSPPTVSSEPPPLTPVERGRISLDVNWTQVLFDEKGIDEKMIGATFAAATFLFSEEERDFELSIFTDDPFKLFCNNKLIASGDNAMGEKGIVSLRVGWNRLLTVQEPERNSMGMVLLFPDDDFGRNLRIYQDMVETAPPAWNTVGPLKLSLAEATPSLRLERLPVRPYEPSLAEASDPATLLTVSDFEKQEDPDYAAPLRTCDYLLYRLDMLRYGSVRVVVEAHAGDVIDITTGSRRLGNGFIIPGEKMRGTGTLVCRNGKNIFLGFLPGDCFYVMISVRSATDTVKVRMVSFEELAISSTRECIFHSSDEVLNRFWLIGRQTLRRSAAFVPLAESRADYDCYMLDSYIDSVNMAAVFGDFDYATARLRQFIDAQLENGDIPVLTFGPRRASQIHHLFFFPVWIYYNYRYSANLGELKRTIPSLDLAREYFETMLDDKTGLIVDIETRFGLESRLSFGHFEANEVPTYVNALFCRFLLSAAEIYRAAGDAEQAKRSLKLAQKVAQRLTESNFDPDAQLFCRWSRDSKRKPDHNLFANFSAMYGGVLPLESFEHFFYSFFNYDPPFDRSDESRHPYFHFLFLEMMFALGQRDWAFRYFRDYWSKRLCDAPGAWRSELGSDDPAPTKFSEGSCVSPNIFLLREVLGIRIAEAGHSVIYFNPAINLVSWAEGVLPMARGRLKVRWEKLPDGSLDVMLDSDVPVKILPLLSHKRLSMTTFRKGDKVTLLNPPPEVDEEEEEFDGLLEDQEPPEEQEEAIRVQVSVSLGSGRG